LRFLRFGWKNLKRHKVRSILTVAGIAISAMTLFAILAFNSGYDKALDSEMKSSGVHLYISMEGCPMQAASLILHGGEIPSYLEESMLGAVQANPDVRKAGGMLISSVISNGRADLFYGITREIKDLKTGWRLDGSWFKGKNSVILGYDIAHDQHKKPGDNIEIKSLGRTFKVTGVLEKSSNEDDGFYFLPLDTAQEIFQKPAKLTVIGIQLTDPTKIQRVQTELERKGAYVVPAGDIANLITDLVGNTKSMLFAIMAIVLIVTGIGVFNTVLMATFERNTEFGYLRCVGAQRTHIFGLILLETMMLAVAGIVVGSVVGYGLSFVIDNWIRGFLPYAPAGKLLRPDVLGVLIMIGVVLLMGVLAGLYPGYKASKVSPMEAARDE
jgi:putative ABC transport system permease protein